MANTKLHPAEQYAQQVRDKEILTCELVQLAVQRYYRDQDNAFDKGWYFDRKAAVRAITFIERLKHTKGEWAGQRFRLEPWQQFIIWNIFGWKNADGTRRFRYAYIEIARKNGKTALSAGIGLYMLFADGEARPEVYSAATVKDQAKICFSDAVEIVKATDLKNYLTPYRNSIVYELKGGMMKPWKTRYKGEIVPSSDRAFKQFKSRGWGYRAIFVLLESYHKRGIKTIRQIISRYAPPCENDTEGYIRSVCESSLIGADAPLDITDKDTMVLVVSAISKVENGTPAVIDEVLEGWDLYQQHRP